MVVKLSSLPGHITICLTEVDIHNNLTGEVGKGEGGSFQVLYK